MMMIIAMIVIEMITHDTYEDNDNIYNPYNGFNDNNDNDEGAVCVYRYTYMVRKREVLWFGTVKLHNCI